MINYESELFRVAPQVREVMLLAKTLNNGSIMRGRTGWIRRNIKNPESIYEHCCKMGLATHYLFDNPDATSEGVAHDFPEIIRPDYIPGDIDPKIKQKGEFNAMKELKEILPNGDYWYSVWEKFENQTGIGGQQLFELDRMCPCIQVINYSKVYSDNNLGEFYDGAKEKVKTPELRNLLDRLCLDIAPPEKDAYEIYFEELKKIKLK